MNKKVKLLILISAIDFSGCLLSGALGWQTQTLVVSILTAVSFFLSFRITQRILPSVLVVFPFLFLYTPLSLYVHNVLNYPVWVCGIFTAIVATVVIPLAQKRLWPIIIFIPLFFTEYFYIYPNYFNYIVSRDRPRGIDISSLKLINQSGKEVTPASFKGKVVLFDLWHSACLPCIKQFPELQKLYNSFKSDTSIKIVSLNIPLKRDDSFNVDALTRKFTFEKYYVADTAQYHSLLGEVVPLVLILDKHSVCRYAGELYTGWNILVQNPQRIINRLRNEEN